MPDLPPRIVRTPRRWRGAGIALATALALGAVATSHVPRPGPGPGAAAWLTVDGAPEQAASLRRVADVLRAELGLPLPARVTAHIYDGRARFEQGLVTHAAVPAGRAAELAAFAIGATIPGSVLLVAPARASAGSAEWPRLVAHELTHLAQLELAGGGDGPAQWLAEGMAEWAAYRVVDRLGLDGFAARRALARAAAVEYVRRAGGLDLDALATAEDFVAGHRRVGSLLTYRLTLHLADRLVARRGFPSLVAYFRSFRASDDAAGNFGAGFGLSVDAFEQETLAGLAAGPSPAGHRVSPVQDVLPSA